MASPQPFVKGVCGHGDLTISVFRQEKGYESGHVIGDGRLRDLDAELEPLAMDPRRTPNGIGSAHLPDQVSKVLRDPRPAAPGA
jgi:hypothetical protein